MISISHHQSVFNTRDLSVYQASFTYRKDLHKAQHWCCCSMCNKANLRNLITATSLVILVKLDSNHRFFSPCDPEIWRMTFKNKRASLLCYFKLCASFQCHRLIQTGVTVRKHLIWVKIDDFFSRVTLKFDVWLWKTKGRLLYATSSYVHHFVAIG